MSGTDDLFGPGEYAGRGVSRYQATIGSCFACEQSFRRSRGFTWACSDACKQKLAQKRIVGPQHRPCRGCGTVFTRHGRGHAKKQHCSEACAAASARKSRAEFARKRPERLDAYRENHRKKGKRDTALTRMWRKYPEMPRACESCGEDRVLDIAHRPEHRRLGAWRTMSNTTPEKVYILCPRCHALLDRLGYTAEQLGIRPRQSVVAA